MLSLTASLPDRLSRSYGEAKYQPESGARDRIAWIDPWKSPCHTLAFRYRSRTLLELEDIVKRESYRLALHRCPAETSFVAIVHATPPPNLLEPASSPAAGPSSRKRKTDVITISDDEDDDAVERGKQNKGGVKTEKKPKVRDEPLRMAVKKENGQTVIDLLD